MRKSVLIIGTTVLFAAIGLYLGYTIHGPSWRAALSTVSGGLGGFGIGFLGCDLWRKHRVSL